MSFSVGHCVVVFFNSEEFDGCVETMFPFKWVVGENLVNLVL